MLRLLPRRCVSLMAMNAALFTITENLKGVEVCQLDDSRPLLDHLRDGGNPLEAIVNYYKAVGEMQLANISCFIMPSCYNGHWMSAILNRVNSTT